MAIVKYFEEFELVKKFLNLKKHLFRQTILMLRIGLLPDQEFRYEYITKTLYPQMTVRLFEYLSLMKNVKCSKDGILDIAKYLIEQCMRSQDVLELSQAPIEIFLQAAKELTLLQQLKY